MPTRSSSYTIDAAAKTASLSRTVGGVTIPSFALADGVVALPARPQITLSMSDIKFLISEARHWIALVGSRLDMPPNVPALLGGEFVYTYTVTGGTELVNSVTVSMDIADLAGGSVSLSGIWSRPSGDIVVSARPAIKIRWQDYVDIIHLFEELVQIVETGKRT